MLGRHGLTALGLTVLLTLAGCLGVTDDLDAASLDAADLDLPDLGTETVADPWYDADGVPNTHYHANPTGEDAPFHSLEEIEEKIMTWEAEHPDLIDVRIIGESLEGRPIWDVIVTDESVGGEKLTPLIDGGHHANELGGIEITLFTVDFLLQNHATNATVRGLLDTLEVHVVPLVNPDGYVRQTRGNALGVNLNRNYDIDWGNPGGASNLLMGTLAHATGQAMPSIPIVAENCGPEAFSEPETRAMRDLMHELAPTASFYLTGHTPTHAVISPWAAYDPPFPVPDEHRAVLESVLDWVRTETEYEAGKAEWGNLSAGLPYSASGSSMDYFYVVTERPAFTVEVEFWYSAATSKDWPMRALGDFEGLRYWMDATLPIVLHMLENADEMAPWDHPSDPVLVPEGSRPVPPDRAEWHHPPIGIH